MQSQSGYYMLLLTVKKQTVVSCLLIILAAFLFSKSNAEIPLGFQKNGANDIKKPVSEKVLADTGKNVFSQGDSMYRSEVIDVAYRRDIPFWKSRDSAEARVFNKSNNILYRTGPRILAIKTEPGEILYFRDDGYCVGIGECDQYVAIDYLPKPGICVLQNLGTEGEDTLLIITGTGEIVSGQPTDVKASPDGKRFFIATHGTMGGNYWGCYLSGFLLWERTPHGLRNVFETDWYTTREGQSAHWINNSTIALANPVTLDYNDSLFTVIVHDTLVHAFGKWFRETMGRCTYKKSGLQINVEDSKARCIESAEGRCQPYVLDGQYSGASEAMARELSSTYHQPYYVDISNKINSFRLTFKGNEDKKSRRINKYIQLLNHPFLYVRCRAIDALGQFEDPRAIAMLIKVVNNVEQNRMFDSPCDDRAYSVLLASKGPVEAQFAEIWKEEPLTSMNCCGISDFGLESFASIATVKSVPLLKWIAENASYTKTLTARRALHRIDSLEESVVPDNGEKRLLAYLDTVPFFNNSCGTYSLSIFKQFKDILLGPASSLRMGAMKRIESGFQIGYVKPFLLGECIAHGNREIRMWALNLLPRSVWEGQEWFAKTLLEKTVKDRDTVVSGLAAKVFKEL